MMAALCRDEGDRQIILHIVEEMEEETGTEIPFDVGGVYDVDDQPGVLLQDEIPGNHFF